MPTNPTPQHGVGYDTNAAAGDDVSANAGDNASPGADGLDCVGHARIADSTANAAGDANDNAVNNDARAAGDANDNAGDNDARAGGDANDNAGDNDARAGGDANDNAGNNDASAAGDANDNASGDDANPSAGADSLDALLSAIADAHPDRVAGWIRNEPGHWGFFAGQSVLAVRNLIGRRLQEPERRFVWHQMWQTLQKRHHHPPDH